MFKSISAEARQIWQNRRKQADTLGKVGGVGYHTSFKAEVAEKLKMGLLEDGSLTPAANNYALDLLGAGLSRKTLGNWMKRYAQVQDFYVNVGKTTIPTSIAHAVKSAIPASAYQFDWMNADYASKSKTVSA